MGLWKHIRRGCDNFSRLSHDGCDASKIWHDFWIGENTLKKIPNFFFLITRDRETIVADYMRLGPQPIGSITCG